MKDFIASKRWSTVIGVGHFQVFVLMKIVQISTNRFPTVEWDYSHENLAIKAEASLSYLPKTLWSI